MENEQADPGRDGLTRLARPNYQARTGTGKCSFSCSTDHEQDWQPYPVDPSLAICDDHTYIHTCCLLLCDRILDSDSKPPNSQTLKLVRELSIEV